MVLQRGSSRSRNAKRIFNPTQCWQNYREGLEILTPLDEALEQEAVSLQQCFEEQWSVTATTNNQVDLSSKSDVVSKDSSGDLVNSQVEGQLQQLDQLVDQCITVKGGISKQYIYRSLYAAQIFHCFKVSSKLTTIMVFILSDRQTYLIGH
jgi:hypothetical protein